MSSQAPKKRDHITPVLQALHRLPVNFRITCKIAIYTYIVKLTRRSEYCCEYRPGQSLTCTAGTKRSDLRWRGAALFPADAQGVQSKFISGLRVSSGGLSSFHILFHVSLTFDKHLVGE